MDKPDTLIYVMGIKGPSARVIRNGAKTTLKPLASHDLTPEQAQLTMAQLIDLFPPPEYSPK